jgi:flagellin-like protein
MKILKSKKALSPVVASIILIAVTVAVSIAVAAWMGALTFNFMGVEKLQVSKVTWSPNTGFDINVTNAGTKDTTIDHVEINYVRVTFDKIDPDPPTLLTTKSGSNTIVYKITFDYTNGTAYDVSVVSTSGYKFTGNYAGGNNIG